MDNKGRIVLSNKSMLILWIILSILCCIYGILIASLNSGGLFFVFWFILAAVFAVFAIAVRFHWWDILPIVLKRVFIVCIIVACGLFAFVEALVISGFGAKSPEGLDYIVVLGAQVHENGPSVVLKYRLDTAIRYLNDNPETICIVSGAQGFNEPFTEAEGMAQYLEQMGILPGRIIREERAENTTGNIKYSMEIIEKREYGLIGDKNTPEDGMSSKTRPNEDTSLNPDGLDRRKTSITLGIVTNNFHVFRSLYIAKAYLQKENVDGIETSGIAAPSKLLYLPNNMTREFFGVVKDFILGNLK